MLVIVEFISVQVYNFWWLHRVVEGRHTLLNRVNELLADIFFPFGTKDSPSLQHRLIVHFSLRLTIKIGCLLNRHLVPLIRRSFSKDHCSWMQLGSFQAQRLTVQLDLEIVQAAERILVLRIVDFLTQILSVFHAFSGCALSGLRDVFIQGEISAHFVGHSRHAAQFWDQINFAFGPLIH